MWSFFHRLIAPKNFYRFSGQLMPWLAVSFVLTLIYGLWGGLVQAPADYLQGDGFRIIYVHAPAAFLSLAIYAAMAIAAFIGIVWRIKLAFLFIKHSATIGATFTLIALITGSLWGKPMWGTWWIWDARLTSELILFFIYLGTILFQQASMQKRNGERALAILVLVGFLDIPIIHYSVYWWNTLHQGATLKLTAPSAIDSSMMYPLLAMMVAFFCYFAMVVTMKMRHELRCLYPHYVEER